MNFNGLVGDLGSRSSSGKVTFNVSINCEGDEGNFVERCKKRYEGATIMNSGTSRNGMGGLVWSARIEKVGAGV